MRRILAAGACVILAGCGSPRFETVAVTDARVTSSLPASSGLWIGSSSEGLIRISNGEGKASGEESGLEGAFGQVMWVEEYGKGLVLATNGGVVEFSAERAKVARAWTSRDGLGNDRVRWAGTLGGELWAATIAGASRLLPGGRRWLNYGTAAGLPQGHIYRMAHAEGTVWASCMNAGLARFSRRSGRWSVVPQVRGIGNKWIYAMSAGPGGLWLGTAGGVNLYSTTRKAWDEDICADGFTDYTVRAIAVDGNVVWFGTSDGVYRRDLETGEQELFTAADGLPGNDVVGLRLSGGILWVTTTRGVAKARSEV